jgi:F0F1-type ATP synthase assembly protein I
MSVATTELAAKTRTVLMAQALAGVLVAALFLFTGLWAGVSALYGSAVSMAATYMLGRRVKRAAHVALTDSRRSMMVLYVGAVQRFIAVLALLALGLAALKMTPTAVVIGFVVAQISYLVGARAGGRDIHKKEQNSE